MTEKKNRKTYQRSGTSAEEFVRIWMEEEGNLKKVMKRTGIKSEHSVRTRADNYRKKGIPLPSAPKMEKSRGRKTIDIAALKKIVAEYKKLKDAPPIEVKEPKPLKTTPKPKMDHKDHSQEKKKRERRYDWTYSLPTNGSR